MIDADVVAGGAASAGDALLGGLAGTAASAAMRLVGLQVVAGACANGISRRATDAVGARLARATDVAAAATMGRVGLAIDATSVADVCGNTALSECA